MRKKIWIAIACLIVVGAVLAVIIGTQSTQPPTPTASETLPTLDDSYLGEWVS